MGRVTKRKPATKEATTKREQSSMPGEQFVTAWLDYRTPQGKAQGRIGSKNSSTTLLPREWVPNVIRKAYDDMHRQGRGNMVQTFAIERLVAHQDMKEAYRIIAQKNRKVTDQQWRVFVTAVINARHAGRNIEVTQERLKLANSAMKLIALHAEKLDEAINDFWQQATTPNEWWRIAVLQCPLEALSYPENRENLNPTIEVNQMPFNDPPIRRLIQRLATEAKSFKAIPADAVMRSAIERDRTAQRAFVRAFDATIANVERANRIMVGPKPLAITALVMLRDHHRKTWRQDWGSWTNAIKQIRHRALTTD